MMLFRNEAGEIRARLEAEELGVYLMLLILQRGGAVTITLEELERWHLDDCHLAVEQAPTDGLGLVISVERDGDERAGHA